MEMPEMQSRRHPDISVYLAPAPNPESQPWESWIPEIVIEVVSDSSRRRDFDEKPDEYLKAGVRLYWIIDPLNRSAVVLTRHADRWQSSELGAAGVLTTGMLPAFELRLADVFRVLN